MRLAPALLLGLLLGPVAPAKSAVADSVVECPHSIEVDETGRSLPEWQTMVTRENRTHLLEGVSIFGGPPNELGDLKPTFATGDSKKAGKTVTFEFPAVDPKGIFVACRYESTTVIAFKQVLPHPKKCSYLRRETAHGLAPIRVTCQ